MIASNEWSIGTVLLDYYVVEKILGFGGMGKVYLVRNNITNDLYAVKHSLLDSVGDKRGFYLELLNWLDLPENLNIAGCCFFRTINEEVVIFAEYISGGSLYDWIKSKRFTGTDQLIDIAIQMALGLDAIHQKGLVHQDIKPKNVLLTNNKVAKIADFGLARARTRENENKGYGTQFKFVSFAGRATHQFRSPEQARGEKLNRKTDVWSWGLTVLAMFAQEVFWQDGIFAIDILEKYLNPASRNPRIYQLPEGLSELLSKCFTTDLNQRYQSMEGVVNKLMDIYLAETGHSYQLTLPSVSVPSNYEFERQTNTLMWRSPDYWLINALEADSRNAKELVDLLYPKYSSRKAQVAADLAGYEEAKQIVDRLVEQGRVDLQVSQAMLYIQKAVIHQAIGDFPGGIELSDSAIKSLTALVENNLDHDKVLRCSDLAFAYTVRAFLADAIGDKKNALNMNAEAIQLFEGVAHEGIVGLFYLLSVLYEQRVFLLNEINNEIADEQLTILDRVIQLRELLIQDDMVHHAGTIDNPFVVEDPLESLSRAIVNKGIFLQGISRHEEAIENFDSCLQIRKSLAYSRKDGLASAYFHKAISTSEIFGPKEALILINDAIDIIEKEIQENDRYDLIPMLALVYWSKAHELKKDGQILEYTVWAEKSISQYERLIRDEGLFNQISRLVELYTKHSSVLANLHQWDQSLSLLDRGIRLVEQFFHNDEGINVRINVAKLYAKKGMTTVNYGNPLEALPLIDHALAILAEFEAEQHECFWLDFGEIYYTKAYTTFACGDLAEAERFCDRAIGFLGNLNDIKLTEYQFDLLARIYKQQSDIFQVSGDFQKAIKCYDILIERFNKVNEKHLTTDIKGQLADVFNNKGIALISIGKPKEALQALENAIEIWQHFVEKLRRFDFADKLALAKNNQGNAQILLSLKEDAHQSYNDAIKICEQLIYDQNRHELENQLAKVYVNKGEIYRHSGEPEKASPWYEKAIAIREPLVLQQDHFELADTLANVYLNQAAVLRDIGNAQAGKVLCDRAHDLLTTLVEQRGFAQLRGDLGIAKANLALFTSELVDLKEARPLALDAARILDEEYNRTRQFKFRKARKWLDETLGFLLF